MLLLRGRRWQLQCWFIGVLSVLSLVVFLQRNRWYPGFAFYMLPARAWELAGGVLLAIFEANTDSAKRALPSWAAQSLSVAGGGLIAIALFLYRSAACPYGLPQISQVSF